MQLNNFIKFVFSFVLNMRNFYPFAKKHSENLGISITPRKCHCIQINHSLCISLVKWKRNKLYAFKCRIFEMQRPGPRKKLKLYLTLTFWRLQKKKNCTIVVPYLHVGVQKEFSVHTNSILIDPLPRGLGQTDNPKLVPGYTRVTLAPDLALSSPSC